MCVSSCCTAIFDSHPHDKGRQSPTGVCLMSAPSASAWLAQRLDKAKARRFLSDKIDLALVPAPDLLGV